MGACVRVPTCSRGHCDLDVAGALLHGELHGVGVCVEGFCCASDCQQDRVPGLCGDANVFFLEHESVNMHTVKNGGSSICVAPSAGWCMF